MVENVVIIGSEINAKIIFDIITREPTITVSAFAVHHSFLTSKELFGKKVIPFENLTKDFPPTDFKLINAVGYSNLNKNREKIFNEAKQLGYSFLTYIHHAATNFSQNIGEGALVMPGAIIEPFATIGFNSVIWSNVVIAHNATIEENCWIASGSVIAGEAKIKRNSFLGINTSIVNKITVGEYNIIGARSLIAKNTAANSVFLARSGELHRFPSDIYAKHFLV